MTAAANGAQPGVSRFAAPAVVALVVLGAWQALVVAYDVPAYLVPSPLLVARTLIADRALLLASLGVTLGVALTALGISIVLGALIALLFVRSRWIEMSLFPYAILLQVTPIVAIAPLIIIWVRDTRTALVLCAVVVAIFPIISNTTLGLRSADPGLLNLFRMYRASRWQILVRLRVPSALPYFFGGCASPAAWRLSALSSPNLSPAREDKVRASRIRSCSRGFSSTFRGCLPRCC